MEERIKTLEERVSTLSTNVAINALDTTCEEFKKNKDLITELKDKVKELESHLKEEKKHIDQLTNNVQKLVNQQENLIQIVTLMVKHSREETEKPEEAKLEKCDFGQDKIYRESLAEYAPIITNNIMNLVITDKKLQNLVEQSVL